MAVVPAGVVAWRLVGESTCTSVAWWPPISTVVACGTNPEPVIVTRSPPWNEPSDGVTPATVGPPEVGGAGQTTATGSDRSVVVPSPSWP